MTTLHSLTRNLLKGLLFLLVMMGAAISEAAEAPSLEYRVEKPVGVSGEGLYLVSSVKDRQRFLLHIDCADGWEGKKAFYVKKVNLFSLPAASESLKSEQMSLLNDSFKPAIFKTLQLKNVDACYNFRDQCDFSASKMVSLTPRQGFFETKCSPRAAPGVSPGKPKTAS